MEISFKRTPVDSPSKNVKGYIPQLPPKSSFFKKINAIYTDGICKALEKYESTSYIDYTESTVGNLSVFEFTVIYNEKRIRFSHVYDGIFPWRISKKEREKVIREIKATAGRRKNFDSSFFEDTDKDIYRKFKHAAVIPIEKGYKVIFTKGTISSKTQIFTVNF